MSEISVVFGGPSPEHDVSVLTGLQAARALGAPGADSGSSGNRLQAIYWSKVGDFHAVDPSLEAEAFVTGVPRGGKHLRLVEGPSGGFVAKGRLGSQRGRHASSFGVVVNCCHGGPGEDGTLQAALDLAGVPYTGPDMAGAALGMDKLAFSALMASSGMPMLPRALVEDRHPGFEGPYIVKPRFGGSSIGIEVVEDFDTALALLRSSVHLARGAVVEPYGSELFDLQVAVRCWPALELSAIERPLRNSERQSFLAYSDKYVGGEGMVSAPRELPARLSDKVEGMLRDIATRAALMCGLRGVARLDFLSDGTELYLNEMNTIPGSMAKYLWVDPQVGFSDLLLDMVREASARPTGRFTAAGADGSVLASAGSIASKLG